MSTSVKKASITFRDFYPFYISEHSNPANRRLHFIGTTLAMMLLFFAIVYRNLVLLISVPIVGYGFSWIGHFLFEKNKPAAFKRPLLSFMGDMRMWFEIVTGIRKF